VHIARDESAHPKQDRGFHKALDESAYKEYFEPLRRDQYRFALTRLDPPGGSTLLDVGASFGWMVETGKELGLESWGLEPSPMDYDEQLAGRIFERTLEEYAAQTDLQYDIVTLWHVLEHFRDPFSAVEQMADLVADGGVALIAVPNASGRMFKLASFLAQRVRTNRLMEELWYTHNPNMHRYYPTLQAVALLLGPTHLQIVDSYLLDSFDWRRIWRRSTSSIGRPALRVVGPVLARSGLTRKENLIVVARKPHS
jgi:2-polyprenyl-3-methyl-5-hydroxy-6-metoxy-1,4-benzoquinol methylase